MYILDGVDVLVGFTIRNTLESKLNLLEIKQDILMREFI
jgi:hypothetical protein